MKLHSGLCMQPLNYFSVWNCRSPKMSAMQTNVVVCRAFYHARFGTLGSITNEIFLLWEPSGEIWWFPFSVSLFLPSSLHLVHSSSLFSLSLFILILFLFCPCCFSQCTYFMFALPAFTFSTSLFFLPADCVYPSITKRWVSLHTNCFALTWAVNHTTINILICYKKQKLYPLQWYTSCVFHPSLITTLLNYIHNLWTYNK